VRQPWAWAIFHGKDIENRDWPTTLRGRVLIHSAKGCKYEEYAEARAFMLNIPEADWSRSNAIPMMPYLLKGFIIGSVEIVDCVERSDSPWFMGRYGFVLKDPQRFGVPIPAKGALGFWNYTGALPE
jgi:hypothetical protein